MDKLDARLFCAVLVFLTLQFSKHVSMAEHQQTFIDVMKNDEKLCQVSNFLYNSSLIKNCKNSEYPTKASELGYSNWNTFMCLLVYDTSYRLCSYGKNWQNPFDSSAAFDAYINNFLVIKTDIEKESFCKNIRELTPVYDKTRQIVLPLFKYLNDTRKCNSLCFFIPEQLNPLCTVLGWVKNVEDNVQKTVPSNPSSDRIAQTDKKVTQKGAQPVQSQGNADNLHALGSTENNPRNPAAMAITNEGNRRPQNDLDHPVEAISNPDKNIGTNEANPQQKPKNMDIPKNDGDINESNAQNPQGVIASNANNLNENSHNGDNDAKDSTHNELNEKSNNNVDNNGNEPNSLQRNQSPKTTGDDPGNMAKTQQKNQDSNTNVNNQDNGDNGLKVSKEKVDNKENLSVTNTDIKTSTISDNTQDLAGRQEYSNLDNDPYDQDDDANRDGDPSDKNPNIPEPSEQREILPQYHSIRPDEESHFLTYFTVLCLFCIAGYIGYHNKQKILAIVVEGRRSRNSRNRRRPSTANYRKLDCTLEEAVTSQCNANVTHVIY